MKLEPESATRRVRILVREHERVPDGRCVIAECNGLPARRADAPGATWPEERGLVLYPRFRPEWLSAEERDSIEIEACALLGLDWTIIRVTWVRA